VFFKQGEVSGLAGHMEPLVAIPHHHSLECGLDHHTGDIEDVTPAAAVSSPRRAWPTRTGTRGGGRRGSSELAAPLLPAPLEEGSAQDRDADADQADATLQPGAKQQPTAHRPQPTTVHSDSLLAAAPSTTVVSQQQQQRRRPSPVPLLHLVTMLVLTSWVLASDIAQGSMVCGTLAYWATQLSVLLPVTAILLGFRAALLRLVVVVGTTAQIVFML
jgi:hypothetical protein